MKTYTTWKVVVLGNGLLHLLEIQALEIVFKDLERIGKDPIAMKPAPWVPDFQKAHKYTSSPKSLKDAKWTYKFPDVVTPREEVSLGRTQKHLECPEHVLEFSEGHLGHLPYLRKILYLRNSCGTLEGYPKCSSSLKYPKDVKWVCNFPDAIRMP